MTHYERMFAYGTNNFKRLFGIAALFAALVTVGCGSGAETRGEAAQESADPTAPEPDLAGADAAEVEVITNWIAALSEGDVEAAAGYFAVPSTAENGPVLLRIRNRKDAIAFNEGLPCGGELVSAETVGDFTTATFELTERPGGGCGAGTGATASTSFVIEGGKIAEWRRVSEDGSGPGPDAAPV